MPRLLLPILLFSFFLFCLAQDKIIADIISQRKAYQNAEILFNRAEKLSEVAGDDEDLIAKADEVYEQALQEFTSLAGISERTGNDSILFFSQLKAGLISFYLGRQDSAKNFWNDASFLKQRLPAIEDSFLFVPLIYTGGIYYSRNQFDSAFSIYKKAEILADKYRQKLSGSERLNNRLGVMYYEMGNYRQARNYFEKAIALSGAGDQGLVLNYKINIASLLTKLEEYSIADSFYKSVLSEGMYTDEINHNLGIISLRQNKPADAINYFRKVNYGANKKNIDLHYNHMLGFSELKQNDSANYHYELALAENTRWNGSRRNIQHGLILKAKADNLYQAGSHHEALHKYQEAIIQFDENFENTDPVTNPSAFEGVYSYINLFNTLTAKADCYESLYQKNREPITLQNALDAYKAAFKLADHVERSYDSDEARLFLNKLKHAAHSKPIALCIQLYKLKSDHDLLEQAYFFDQRNKASVLSLNMLESGLKSRNAETNELLNRSAEYKRSITRLSIKATQTTDSILLDQIRNELRDASIELGKINEKIKNDPAYTELHVTEKIPTIQSVQKQIDNQTAILSWHLSPSSLLVLIITGNRFTYQQVPIDSAFIALIDSFKTSLHNTNEQRFNGSSASSSLYEILIRPISQKLQGITRLIIIPDDELNYLPFEALQDKNKSYLVQNFSVQYQFSTALLNHPKNKNKASSILAVAPFASKGSTDSLGVVLRSLPASKEEVINLKGLILLDSIGTKENFIRAADQYQVIHLATHASVNNEEPNRSFINFYPDKPDNKLYAQEIYDMDLDSTKLVILSACETGAGLLVKGEGLMSLSRAFAYAGCTNIITSLWKAEDKVTAFITTRLHHHIAKGSPYGKALQQAKNDLIDSKEVDPRLKSPNYWAHLVLIGDYESSQTKQPWWWIALGLIGGGLIYLFFRKKS